MHLDYEILYTSKGKNIAPLIVEACGSDIDMFNRAHQYANSIIPYKVDQSLSKLIKSTGGNSNAYQDISAKAFEIMVGIAIAQSPAAIKQKYNKEKISLRYNIRVKDKYGTKNHQRIATDIDICLPKTWVEATITDDGILRINDIKTRNTKLSKCYVLQNPDLVVKNQRQKIKKIKDAVLVLPKQIALDTRKLPANSIEDINDTYALKKTITHIKKLQKELNLKILKTSTEWNGEKYMPSGMEFTKENLQKLHETNLTKMSLDNCIRMFEGDPDEILMRN